MIWWTVDVPQQSPRHRGGGFLIHGVWNGPRNDRNAFRFSFRTD